METTPTPLELMRPQIAAAVGPIDYRSIGDDCANIRAQRGAKVACVPSHHFGIAAQ